MDDLNSKQKSRALYIAAASGAISSAGFTALAFIGSQFSGQQKEDHLNFFMFIRGIVGLPTFCLVGGADISELGAAFICIIVNATLGAVIFSVLFYVWRFTARIL